MKFKLLSILIAFSLITQAQLSLYNLAEYQYGNIPDKDPFHRHGLYNNLNVQYRLNSLTGFARLELYDASDPIDNDYVHLAQYRLSYAFNDFDFSVGHFFETLGRGLLLRSYEIKNGLIEDPGDRIKHAFYRDMHGVKGVYSSDYFSAKGLYGNMLDQTLTPDLDTRYIDEIAAGEIAAYFDGQQLGLMYLQNKNDVDTIEWLGAYLEGNIGDNLSYYFEYINKNNQFSAFNHSLKAAYGLYGSLSYSNNGYGLSIEYKDYNLMRIGTGVNEPPTLVKEHNYRLLNRSTHIVELINEEGLQVEIFANVLDNSLVTINYSYGINELFGSRLKYSEVFLEYVRDFEAGHELKVFAQNSYDYFALAKDRISTGVYYSHHFAKGYTIGFESEYQQIIPTWTDEITDNVYVGLTFAKSTKLSASLQLEYTNDIQFRDRENTTELEIERFYPGATIQFKPNYKNNFLLFVGERRGGPACTSGICYEVLDFKGVEIRYTYRL